MRIRPLSLALALSPAVLSACEFDLSGPGPARPGPDRRVKEVHGQFVASTAPGGTAITWSGSGEELTFVSPDFRTASAYRLQSGAIRQLYASTSTTEQTYDAALSVDGVEWFTTSSGSRGRVIRGHTSDGSTVLTDRGSGGLGWPAGGRGVLVAPGQAVVAFLVGSDSLFLLQRGGAPSLLGTGCSTIITFSPDESRILCSAGGFPPTYRVFRVDAGTTEPLVLSSSVSGTPHLMRWGAQGVQVIYTRYADGDQYMLYDQGTGATRTLTPPAKYPESLSRQASWSADGRKAAYWAWFCAQSGDFLGPCLVNQAFLYVIDVATGTAQRVAVHTSSGQVHVAVSPNGSMIAYSVNGGLYVLQVK